MATGNHKIHTQHGEERDGVELAHLNAVLRGVEPFGSHKEYHDDANVEHTLHYGHHSGVLIHSAKGLSRCGTSRAPGYEVDDSVNEHQQHGEDGAEMATTTAHCTCAVGSAGQSALFVAAYEEVGKKQDDDDGEKAKLLGHTKELTIIHSLMSFYKLEERIAL